MGPIVRTEFTPWLSLGGGVLIGLSAVMVMALFGRVAGVSGIASGVLAAMASLRGPPGDRGWRVAFILGLFAAPPVMALVGALVGAPVEQTLSDNVLGMALAGLLVGVGTAIGSGCTSGHGVCGLARLSRRSAVAVTVFMAAAFATVFMLRHIAGGL